METLRRLRLFRELPDGVILEMARASRFRDVERGEIVLGPADKGLGLGVLLSGRARLMTCDRVGREVELDAIGPGDLFGERTHLGDKPLEGCDYVVAEEVCRVMMVPGEALEALTERHPQLGLRLARCLCGKIVRLDQRFLQAEQARSDLCEVVRQRDDDVEVPHHDLAETPFFRQHERALRALAESGDSVLLSGEAGVGKHELARILYRLSRRFDRILVTANFYLRDEAEPAAAERLLFGGVDGDRRVPGLMELGRGGTLMLLGLELLPVALQERLYRRIQEQKFPSAGSAGAWSPGPRLLICSVRDLPTLRRDGCILPELADYFATRHVMIPPLRERRRDIPVLAQSYLRRYGREVGREVSSVSPETLKTLLDHAWPGNETELAETVKRGVILCSGSVLQPEDVYLDLRRPAARGKLDLLRLPFVRLALRSPVFPGALQWGVAPLFIVLLAFLLFGTQDAERNPAAVVSWALGWPMLTAGSFLWGRFWCAICPMGSIGALLGRFVSLRVPAPHLLKKLAPWIVAGVAVGILWIETVAGLRLHPCRLGVLLLGVAGLSAAFSLIFERQVWCSYLCGLGGMMGLFARASPLELRADRNVCVARCTGHECYTGARGRQGCPYFQLAPAVESNQNCKLCGGCVKNCEHHSLSLFLRVPGRELWEQAEGTPSVSVFVAAMLGALAAERLAGSELFLRWTDTLGVPLPAASTAAFGTLVTLAVALSLGASAVSARLGGRRTREDLSIYGRAHLPLVLAGFAAHHGRSLLALDARFARLGAERFGVRPASGLLGAALPDADHWAPWALLTLGALGAAFVLARIARGRGGPAGRALAVLLPHLLVCAAFTGALGWALSLGPPALPSGAWPP